MTFLQDLMSGLLSKITLLYKFLIASPSSVYLSPNGNLTTITTCLLETGFWGPQKRLHFFNLPLLGKLLIFVGRPTWTPLYDFNNLVEEFQTGFKTNRSNETFQVRVINDLLDSKPYHTCSSELFSLLLTVCHNMYFTCYSFCNIFTYLWESSDSITAFLLPFTWCPTRLNYQLSYCRYTHAW